MGLALHNYAPAHGGLPPAAITSRNGKRLLSWRVAILPYIDQAFLYQKFKLDEPWDSPHNKELLKYMPKIFECPSKPVPGAGMTCYRAFLGKDTLLDPVRSIRIAAVTDGMSNTLMVVEARDAVPWTKPDDLPFDPAKHARGNGILGAGSAHPGGFNAAFADGSVRFIKASVPLDVLRALITRCGGEVIPGDAFRDSCPSEHRLLTAAELRDEPARHRDGQDRDRLGPAHDPRAAREAGLRQRRAKHRSFP